MHKNFAMMVLQTVSHTGAEACPPPCVNITNKLQPFGHRRGRKTSTRPIRFAQLVEPVLPPLGAQLVPATSQARDHAGKPLKDFLPADLRSPERRRFPRPPRPRAGGGARALSSRPAWWC